MNKTGLTIAFDGPDGVGKTTQIELYKDYLESKGQQVFLTRSSGGTPIGEALRKVSLDSSLSRPAETDVHISLAMNHALAQELPKHRTAAEVILIDRSPLALIAYNVFGSQLQNKQPAIQAACEMIKNWKIDALVYFDADQEILNKRRKERGKLEYFEKMGSDYHSRVRDGYKEGLEIIEAQNLLPVIQVDATPSIQDVQLAMQAALKDFL